MTDDTDGVNCGHLYADAYGNCCKLARAEAKLKKLEDEKADRRFRVSFMAAGNAAGKNFRMAMAAVTDTLDLGKDKLEVTFHNSEDTEKIMKIDNVVNGNYTCSSCGCMAHEEIRKIESILDEKI